jgi:twitching motility protein PilT
MSIPSQPDILTGICAASVECGASDILLHDGRVPRVRVGGNLLELQCEALTPGFFEDLWRMSGAQPDAEDHDGSFVAPSGVRFRVNLFCSLGRRGAVFRRIPVEIPSLDVLGVPVDLLKSWAGARSGLILVCGPAGSGKSTTLAALLDWVNDSMTKHVVTIEDPIEFSFVDRQSLFTQREVGIDTPSFAEGLRRSLRQNPDMIFIGEIRDAVAALTALQASETGHLVLATVHSGTGPEAAERLESLFPPDARDGIRRTLANQLLGVLCQKLLPGVSGEPVLACEFFENHGVITKYLAEGRLSDLADEIAKGDGSRCLGFLSSLANLVKSGKLEEAAAMSASGSPQELQRVLRGVNSSSASTRR